MGGSKNGKEEGERVDGPGRRRVRMWEEGEDAARAAELENCKCLKS